MSSPLPPGAAPVQVTLEEILEEIRELPALPDVVTELIQTLNNESASINALADGIAKDQALAARALRVANSPFYGVQQKVATIHDAIVVLGFRAVGSLVTAASITGYFTPSAGGGFDLYRFWRHSIGVALCARALARHVGQNPEAAFTAGLMHDIGRLLLVTIRPQVYEQILAYRDAQDCLLHQAEQHILGFDHARAGEALALRWRFPPQIVQTVARHHQPEPGRACSLADVVHVADILAHALDLAGEANALVPPLGQEVWQRLGLGWAPLKRLLAEVEDEHVSFCALLN